MFSEPNQLWPSTRLSEELLQKGSGPAVVEIPTFGWVADVGGVQQQGQGFGFVDAVGDNAVRRAITWLLSLKVNRIFLSFSA